MSQTKPKHKIVSVIMWIIVAIVLVAVFVKLISNKKNGRPSFVFGYSLLWVETGSMEPTINTKSFILVKETDGQNISKGTVITFICKDESMAVYNQLITHRVINDVSVDGYYKTKGDNNTYEDSWNSEGGVATGDVVAVYKCNLPVLTFLGRLFSSWAGIAGLSVFFVASMALIYIPDVVRSLKDDVNEQQKDEKQKQMDMLVQQEVERLKREGLNNNETPTEQTGAESNLPNDNK